MATASDAHLHEIVRIHKDLDIFPSIVITEAAYREMRNRRAANHLAISHDEHAGMSTSHPSAPSKTSLDRPEETQERLRALPAVRHPGLPN